MSGTTRPPASALTPTQQRFLREFFQAGTIADDFCLAGGTALAGYYLGHRRSDDIDLFTRLPGKLVAAEERVRATSEAIRLRVVRVSRHEDYCRIDLEGDPEPAHRLLKIDLVRDTPPWFDDPVLRDGVRVEGILDLAVNKLQAAPRAEVRDFVDLYCLFSKGLVQPEVLVELVNQKDSGLEPIYLAGLFEQAGRLPHPERYLQDYLLKAIPWSEMERGLRAAAHRIFNRFPPRGESA